MQKINSNGFIKTDAAKSWFYAATGEANRISKLLGGKAEDRLLSGMVGNLPCFTDSETHISPHILSSLNWDSSDKRWSVIA